MAVAERRFPVAEPQQGVGGGADNSARARSAAAAEACGGHDVPARGRGSPGRGPAGAAGRAASARARAPAAPRRQLRAVAAAAAHRRDQRPSAPRALQGSLLPEDRSYPSVPATTRAGAAPAAVSA